MKNYLITFCFTGVLSLIMFFGVNTLAQVVEDIDPNPDLSNCVELQNNLRYRSRDATTNGEVSLLQDFLQSKGYLNNEPTGYLGLITVTAIKNFQKANNISPTGYVGPVTRAKIKSMTCGDTDSGEKVTINGYLRPIGISNKMWGTHSMTVKMDAYCKSDPCPPSLEKQYIIIGENEKISNDLKFYENKKVILSGVLKWYELEGGFWGIIASTVSLSEPQDKSSISLLSPNGDEKLKQGSKYIIKWRDDFSGSKCSEGAFCSSPAPKYYDITLASYYPPCTDNVCPMMPYISPYTIAKNVRGSSYNWMIGLVLQDLGNTGSMVPVGSYTIQVCQTGTSTCDSSDYHFKIFSSTDDGCPSGVMYSYTTGKKCDTTSLSISGISGPQTLDIGQEGTWTVKAEGPVGSNLSYNVDWGDNYISPTFEGGNSTTAQSQSATFTHVYLKSGRYEPKFTVTSENTIRCITTPCPSNGGSASASLTVQVNEISNPSVTVLSPNGGESWYKGIKQAIKWQIKDGPSCSVGSSCSLAVTAQKYYDISLITYNPSCGDCPLSPIVSYVIARTDAHGEYVWTVGNVIHPDGSNKYIVSDGSYTIQVCQSGTNVCDSSNSYFRISSSTLPPICQYAAPLQGCNYVPGPNYNSTTQCGMILKCESDAMEQSGNVLGAWDGQYAPISIPPISTNDCKTFTMILRKGIKHREVRCLQRLLNERGFLVAGIANGFETEYFGESTLSALKAFQKNMGLIDDGVAGPKTLKILLGQ